MTLRALREFRDDLEDATEDARGLARDVGELLEGVGHLRRALAPEPAPGPVQDTPSGRRPFVEVSPGVWTR